MEIDTDPPEGMIVHSAGPVDSGWGVIDCWESREAFDTFVQERLLPRLHGLGDRRFPNPPDVKEFAVLRPASLPKAGLATKSFQSWALSGGSGAK